MIRADAVRRGVPPLAAAASPGLARLFLLVWLWWRFGGTTTGLVSSDLALVYFVGFLSAIGWSTTLMTRTAAHPSRSGAFLTTHLAGALVTALVVFPALPYLGAATAPTIWLLMLCVGYGVYQCVRASLVALHGYWRAVVLDFTVHAAPAMVLWNAAATPSDDAAAVTTVLAVAMSVLPLLAAASVWRRGLYGASVQPSARASIVWSDTVREALSLGLAMLVTSGTVFTFVPIVMQEATPQEAAIAALFVNVVSAASLVPRAITLHFLPLLSRTLADRDGGAAMLMRRFRYLSRVSTGGLALVLAVAVALASPWLSGNAILLISSLTIGSVIPMFVTAEIHLMIARGQSHRVLLINLGPSVPYIAIFLLTSAGTLSLGGRVAEWLSVTFVLGAITRCVGFARSRDSRRILETGAGEAAGPT